MRCMDYDGIESTLEIGVAAQMTDWIYYKHCSLLILTNQIWNKMWTFAKVKSATKRWVFFRQPFQLMTMDYFAHDWFRDFCFEIIRTSFSKFSSNFRHFHFQWFFHFSPAVFRWRVKKKFRTNLKWKWIDGKWCKNLLNVCCGQWNDFQLN